MPGMDTTPPALENEIPAVDSVLIMLRALTDAAYAVHGPVENPLLADAKYRALRSCMIGILQDSPRLKRRRGKPGDRIL